MWSVFLEHGLTSAGLQVKVGVLLEVSRWPRTVAETVPDPLTSGQVLEVGLVLPRVRVCFRPSAPCCL